MGFLTSLVLAVAITCHHDVASQQTNHNPDQPSSAPRPDIRVVALCQASCVDQVVQWARSEKECLTNNQCMTCWRLCERFNREGRAPCRKDDCGEGCKAACKFDLSVTASVSKHDDVLYTALTACVVSLGTLTLVALFYCFYRTCCGPHKDFASGTRCSYSHLPVVDVRALNNSFASLHHFSQSAVQPAHLLSPAMMSYTPSGGSSQHSSWYSEASYATLDFHCPHGCADMTSVHQGRWPQTSTLKSAHGMTTEPLDKVTSSANRDTKSKSVDVLHRVDVGRHRAPRPVSSLAATHTQRPLAEIQRTHLSVPLAASARRPARRSLVPGFSLNADRHSLASHDPTSSSSQQPQVHQAVPGLSYTALAMLDVSDGEQSYCPDDGEWEYEQAMLDLSFRA